jgi:molecular chaperone DnaK (HSP70)
VRITEERSPHRPVKAAPERTVSGPSYALGIDLGTTNCALAFVSLRDGGPSTVLTIPQKSLAGGIVERTTLPSFLWRPLDPEGREADPPSSIWEAGQIAREQATFAPGRVIHSAKSWLANTGTEPTEPILPWQSELLPPDQRLSPVAASAALLRHLREAWQAAFPGVVFEDQDFTLGVPSSFDAAAQRATLAAARLAGYPDHLRLLEEPQAAFHRWLEAAGEDGAGALRAGETILVVDLGGGTSDFSLFRVGDARGAIERVAVSDHILLGGDNIDLALAHLLEAQLVPEGEELRGESWSHLLARARDLKERALGSDAVETLRVAVPGRGSGLFTDTLSTEVSSRELREIVLEGFFPLCSRQALPEESRSALAEWGLPYASDFAVTRYLAAFLRGHPLVDAVLFNGGTLAAPVLRERLLDQLGRWQEGRRPRLLDNPETDLAVARGAARHGALLARHARPIASGAARAIFLGLGEDDRPSLLCVLPRGAAPGEIHRASPAGLRAVLHQPVRFRAWQGAHHRNERAGDQVPWEAHGFSEMPSLETTLASPGHSDTSLEVRLESCLNEIGLLQVELVGVEDPRQRWPLAFNLRRPALSPAPPPPAVAPSEGPPQPDDALVQRAGERLRRVFGGDRPVQREPLSPARLLSQIEAILKLPKHAWPLPVIRGLADVLIARAAQRERTADHLATWLHLVGYCLRPGFGDPSDSRRLDQLWGLLGPASFTPTKRIEPLLDLLWRRLAGGLSRERQEALYRAQVAVWTEPKRATAEGVRLAGALERLELAHKQRLVGAFLPVARSLGEARGHAAPYLAALGGLLARSPLRPDGAASTLPPEAVEVAWKQLGHLDPAHPQLGELSPLFLRAARRVAEEPLNLRAKTSRRIADRLRQAGVHPARLAPLTTYIPLAAADTAELYSESLPPGLILDTAKPS